jgi:hypothetical protein
MQTQHNAANFYGESDEGPVIPVTLSLIARALGDASFFYQLNYIDCYRELLVNCAELEYTLPKTVWIVPLDQENN